MSGSPWKPALAALLALWMLLPGCGAAPAPAPAPSEPPPASRAEAPAPREPAPEPEPALPPKPLGIGEAVFSDAGELTPGQQEVILAFVTRYYDSLALLEPRELADLFAPGAEGQCWGNRAVLEFSAGVRGMQPADLSLTGWSSQMAVTEAEEQEDGSLLLQVSEDSVQHFAVTPGVDSRQLGVRHRFILVPGVGTDGWLLSGHSQMDTLYWTVMGRYAWGSPSAGGSEDYYARRVARLLETARTDMGERLARGTEQPSAARNPYDREAAVAYAREWVGKRNPRWPDYSRNGGNCQNFVSQCLLAGGIPMDISAPGVWKWYGETPDNLFRAAGRSAAWSSVQDFHAYAEENAGYGLAAAVDVPYYTGSAGDLLHLGTQERWRHTVIISRVVTDGNGDTVDYLVCSNTADLIDFPAGAYVYTRQALVRIDGSF